MRLLLIALFFWSSALFAQDSNSPKLDLNPVSVNLLYGYYDQDGVHSAVTGGVGSEELNVHAPAIQLNIPLDTNLNLKFEGGVDIVTSASTDKIDFVISSASRKDGHHAKLSVDHQPTNSSRYSIGYSYSMESDYFSNGAHLSYGWTSKDRNSNLNLSSSLFFDYVTWGWHQGEGSVRLIYPQELRGIDWETRTRRYSYNLGISFSHNFHKRLNASLFTVPTYQHGLLITPFHRVYFNGANRAVVEHLPYSRIKIPVGIRANYFVLNRAILRFLYRFYWDDFGIMANTAELTVPVKIGTQFSVQPFYRFYYQTASHYFAPIYSHDPGSEFYTSDYDQSRFFSNKFGVGFRYAPPMGILKLGSESRVGLSAISLRYARYLRSDGLSMHIFSSIITFGQ